MLTHLRSAILWTSAMSACRKGNIPVALKRMESIKSLRPLQLYERAFEASLVLMLGDDGKAEKLFRATAEDAAGTDGPSARYVRLYCRYIVAGLTGDLDEQRDARAKALTVQCRPTLKRWLPL